MKRVLMAFDSINLAAGDFDFIGQLNEIQPTHLTGIFFPGAEEKYAHVPETIQSSSVAAQTVTANTLVNKFTTWCEHNKVSHNIVLLDTDNPFEQLKKATRFADLLILTRTFYSNMPIFSQYQYVHDIVHDAECAVLLLPGKCLFPQKVVLTFDGSSDAAFAIKQFAYLFPAAAFADVTLAYASAKDKEFPDIAYIKEYAVRHYPGLNLVKIDAGTEEYFSAWLQNITAPLLVTGAFNRSPVSELFRRSFLEDIVLYQNAPVFIAHK